MTTRILALIVLATILTACNTFHGMGRDIESAGETLSGTADDAKDNMR